MTWTTRAGDTLVKLEAIPIGMATLDATELVEAKLDAFKNQQQ